MASSPPRRFRYAGQTFTQLANNRAHTFALSYALGIYRANACYSMIPKNGCSTVRFAIARANGCIDSLDEASWIHRNNATFSLSLGEVLRSEYTFSVLRCPFDRLYSAFMDKIVSIDVQAWQLYNSTGRRSLHPHTITFESFVDKITDDPANQLDIHWRPQVAFLVLETYDDLFSLERLSEASPTLETKAGLQIEDSRSAIGHHISGLEQIEMTNAFEATTIELLQLKLDGKCPRVQDLYNDAIVQAVEPLYREDLANYATHFGPSPLMAELL